MIDSSESLETWKTFLETTIPNSNQHLIETAAMIKDGLSQISLESLDPATTTLTKGIARHVIYGREC